MMKADGARTALAQAVLAVARDMGDAEPFDAVRVAVQTLVTFALADAAEERNATQTINAVATELLEMILSFLSLSDLIRATHVCRHWRRVAIAKQVLWSDIRLVRQHTASNLCILHDALRGLISRAGTSVIDLSLIVKPPPQAQNGDERPATFNRTVSPLDLSSLRPVSSQLRTLEIRLYPNGSRASHSFGPPPDLGGNILNSGAEGLLGRSILERLSLHLSDPLFAPVVYYIVGVCSLVFQQLRYLELSGDFALIGHEWAVMPRLRQLVLRSVQDINLNVIASCFAKACVALEKLHLHSRERIFVVPPGPDVHPFNSVSSLVLRGDCQPSVQACVEALGCTSAAHILVDSVTSHARSELAWMHGAVDAPKLCLFRLGPDVVPGVPSDGAIVCTNDARGRTRTDFLSFSPRDVLSDARCSGVTHLTIDERYIDPATVPDPPRMLPVLESLTICVQTVWPKGDPDADEGRCRFFAITLDGAAVPWPCPALRHLDLISSPPLRPSPREDSFHLVTPVRRAVAGSRDLRLFLDRFLAAPLDVVLGLQNVALRERTGHPLRAALKARVTAIEERLAYEMLPIEREWDMWRFQDDFELCYP